MESRLKNLTVILVVAVALITAACAKDIHDSNLIRQQATTDRLQIIANALTNANTEGARTALALLYVTQSQPAQQRINTPLDYVNALTGIARSPLAAPLLGTAGSVDDSNISAGRDVYLSSQQVRSSTGKSNVSDSSSTSADTSNTEETTTTTTESHADTQFEGSYGTNTNN